MRIVRFYAKWYKKCKLFENKELLGYDQDIDIDLPSYHKSVVKYQVSIIPTFIAFNSRKKVIALAQTYFVVQLVELESLFPLFVIIIN